MPGRTLRRMATSEVILRLDHELVEAVAQEAGENGVEEFVERALRNELDRARARRFLDRLDEDLGPIDETLIHHFDELFDQVETANRDD